MKKKIVTFYTILALMFIVLTIILVNTEKNTIIYNIFNPILGLVIISFTLSIIVITIININNNRKKKKEKFSKLTQEEKLEYYKQRELEQSKIIDAKLKRKQEFKILKDNIRKSKTISKVIIVGAVSNSRKKFGSSVIRGAIGGTLFGTAGMLSGALSGENKVNNETTFLIEYEDGHRETKIVNNNSSEFKKLCKYLEM